MNALETALSKSNALITTTATQAYRWKELGIPIGGDSGMGIYGGSREVGANRTRYGLFRGWLYAAINAIATEGAGQPVNMSRILGTSPNPELDRRRVLRTKSHEEEERILYHPALDVLDQPNAIQGRWQFVYSFIANLCLTGWSYVIGDENVDGRLELYSLPTTWVRPDHRDGPFSRFKIVDPRNLKSDGEWLTRDQVSFAHLPNPADPMGALAPAQTQIQAIRVDDHIQTSQERFFENGVFPSVLITVGKDPHPSIPGGGTRPRLSATQRRQVHAAIRKVMGGVANYGNPAIIDGLIEKIERLSATQNEMGWEKSETTVRTRILSSFGVHPYILGEPVNVGGYAQAAKIEERFCKRVNTYLGMLSTLTTNFVGPRFEPEDRLRIWWTLCEPHDPALHWQNMREARKNGDITKNEMRSMLGLPPVDEEEGSRSPLLDTQGGMNGSVGILNAMGAGSITADTAAGLLSLFLQIPRSTADEIIGGGSVQSAVGEVQSELSALRESLQKDSVSRLARAIERQTDLLGATG